MKYKDKEPTAEEKAVAEIKGIATSLNAKLDPIEKRMNDLEESAKSNDGKLTDEQKAEMTKLSDANTQVQKDLKESFDAMQGQLDKLDIGSQYQKGEHPVGFDNHVTHLVKDNIEEIAKIGTKESSAYRLDIKADMTIGADFTGEVIDRDRLPGVFHDPTRQTRVRSFMNVTPTTSDVVRFVKESAYNDGSTMTAEGAAATQSDADFASEDTTVRKLSTYMKISKEMTNDAPFIANFIRIRAMGKLLVKEDQQILYGLGTGQELSGVKTNATAYSDITADSAANKFDIISNAVTNTRNDEYSANVAFVGATDYHKIITQKDSQERYLVPNIYTGQPLVVNGARIMWNTAVTADDLFVADFIRAFTLAMRSDVEITFSNSDQDDFIKGFVTMLVEERLALLSHNEKAAIYTTFTGALGSATA